MNHTGRENRTDTPEQINNCLSCDKPDCDNCIKHVKTERRQKNERVLIERRDAGRN